MLFNTRHMAILASISILANALPFDTPRQIVPRQKNYSVINVDGGSSDGAEATTVIKSTKTVAVVNPGPTITHDVTTTVFSVAPAPTPTTSCSESTTSAAASITSKPVSSSTTSIPIETPKPIFVTVTVPKDDGPTEYYDNGLWHTYYRVKTFEAAVATVVPSPSSSVISSSAVAPALMTSMPSYNQTSV
jgi:hypothetical protein